VPDLDVGLDPAKLRDLVQRAMTTGAGVVRSRASLGAAGGVVAETAALVAETAATGGPAGPPLGELANLCTVAGALLASARAREESRGAHARSEFSEAAPAWRRRLVHGEV
jgi:L-aspartate oxidase